MAASTTSSTAPTTAAAAKTTTVKKQVFTLRAQCWVRLTDVEFCRQVEQGLADGPWSFSEHGKKCEAKLKSSPYDLECWNVLVREAQVCFLTFYNSCMSTVLFVQSTSLLRARMLYERLVTQFPTSGRYWRLYIEHEVNAFRSVWCSLFVLMIGINSWRKSMSVLKPCASLDVVSWARSCIPSNLPNRKVFTALQSDRSVTNNSSGETVNQSTCRVHPQLMKDNV